MNWLHKVEKLITEHESDFRPLNEIKCDPEQSPQRSLLGDASRSLELGDERQMQCRRNSNYQRRERRKNFRPARTASGERAD